MSLGTHLIDVECWELYFLCEVIYTQHFIIIQPMSHMSDVDEGVVLPGVQPLCFETHH